MSLFTFFAKSEVSAVVNANHASALDAVDAYNAEKQRLVAEYNAELAQIESDWSIVDVDNAELDLPVARFINGCTGLSIQDTQ